MSFETVQKTGRAKPLASMLITLLFSLAYFQASFAELPDALGWYEIPNTKIETLNPGLDPAVNPNYPDVTTWHGPTGRFAGLIEAWNSGAYDTKRDRLYIWGGGHGDYYGNELYALDLSNLSVSRLTNPAYPIATSCVRELSPNNGTQPNSRHTYDGIVYMPNVDRVFSFSGALACGTGSSGNDVWWFDPNTNTWERKYPTGDSPASSDTLSVMTAWDSINNKVYLHTRTGGLFVYDPTVGADGEFTRLSSESLTRFHYTMEFDPENNILLASNGQNGNFYWWDVGNGSYTKQTLSATGDSVLQSTYQAPGLVFDPVLKKIIGWNGGTTVYALDWNAKRWDPIVLQGPTPSAPQTRGTYGRFAYSPIQNRYVVINSVDTNAFTLKLTAGGGSAATPRIDLSSSASRVVQGTPVALSWSSADAVSCTASGAWSGTKPTSGSETSAALTTDSSFTLSCDDAQGNTNTRTITVQVTPPPLPSVSLNASATYIANGGNAQLNWNSSDATTCTASGAWSGTKPTSGSASIGPLAADSSHSFTLTCSGAGGERSDTVVVRTVADPSAQYLPRQDFSNDGIGTDPSNWTDTGANNSMAEDDRLFKIYDIDGDNAFGTTNTSATNIHSHYTGAGSSAWQNYRYSGRMRIGSASDNIGVTFYSDYPNSDRYYRLRRESGTSFYISPHGTQCSGTTDSGVTPGANTWYRFLIEVEGNASATAVRAKVWASDSSEPADWQITCSDASASRLTAGTVGLWGVVGGSDSGGKYWDDLEVSPLSATPDPRVNLSASTTSLILGTSTTLSWNSSNVDNCSASGDWSGSKSPSGSQSVTPSRTGTSTYSLDCSGSNGSASARLDIRVSAPPADSDGDGLDDSWEQNYFGNLGQSGSGDADGDGLSNRQEQDLNIDPTQTDSDGDGASDGDEVRYGSNPGDNSDNWQTRRPDRPSVTAIGTAVLRDQLLDSSSYRDPDGDALGSAQWQISQDSGFSQLVLDRRLSGTTGLRIPLGILQGNRDYWVRTRHYDNTGLPSEWSAGRAIRTEAQFAEDRDGNGSDDRYQVTGYADSNGNGINDTDEGLCNLLDAENGMSIGFQASRGNLVCLTSHTVAELPAVVRSGKTLPYGLFTLVIDGLAVDAASPTRVDLTLYFPDAIAANDVWYSYDGVSDRLEAFSGPVNIDGNIVTLTLTDGGAGDLDGVINGVIVDPLGMAIASTDGDPLTIRISGVGAGGWGMWLVMLIYVACRRLRTFSPRM